MLQPEADIFLNRLRDNYQYIQSKVGTAKVMAVVKADAYGHGIVEISNLLVDEGIHGFCVALVSEVQELIQANNQNPILHLGQISFLELDVYETGQVRCTINSINDLKKLEEHASKNNVIFTSHLKVDTGMGRMGIPYEDLEEVVEEISHCNNIIIEGVYSHFSTAEEKDVDYRDWQLERFKKVIATIKENLPEVEFFHIANSAAVLTCEEAYFNMVRPGLSIYGVSPLKVKHESLQPVMKMKAPVALIKQFSKGSAVGYNRQYVTHNNERILILQAGYADGIPREFSSDGKVEINGNLYPIIGKVSMDLIAVRCEEKAIKHGHEAVLWGSDNLRLEFLSKKYEKIPYEFLTGISKRVKRNYINE